MRKFLILIGLSVFALSLSCDLGELFSKKYFLSGIVQAEEMDLSRYLGSEGIDIAREVVGGDAALIASYSQKSDQILADNLTKNYASSTNSEVVAASQAASAADVELKKQLNLIQQNKASVDRSGVSDSEAKDIQKNVEAITKEAIKQYSIIQMKSSVAEKLDEIVKANTPVGPIAKAQAAATAAANLAAQHATDAKAIVTAVAGWKGFTGIPDIGTTETTIETASGDANTQKTAAETAAAAANVSGVTLADAQKGQQDAEAAEKLGSAALLSASQNKSLLDALVTLNLAPTKAAAHSAKLGADAALTVATGTVTAAVLAVKTSNDATKAQAATEAEQDLADVTAAQAQAKAADDAAQAATDLKTAWTQKTAAETAEATAKDKSLDAQMKAVVALTIRFDKDHTPELTAIAADVKDVAGKVAAIKAKADAAAASIPANLTAATNAVTGSTGYKQIRANGTSTVTTFLDRDIEVAKTKFTNAANATIKSILVQVELAKQAEENLKRAQDKAKSAKTYVEVAGLRMLADQQKQIILDAETTAGGIKFSATTLSLTLPLNRYCAYDSNSHTACASGWSTGPFAVGKTYSLYTYDSTNKQYIKGPAGKGMTITSGVGTVGYTNGVGCNLKASLSASICVFDASGSGLRAIVQLYGTGGFLPFVGRMEMVSLDGVFALESGNDALW